MAKQSLLYPYEFSGGMRLGAQKPEDPYDPTNDFSWAASGETDEGYEQFDLRGSATWFQLDFELHARLAAGKLRDLLPPGCDYRRETDLIVSLRCPSSKLRRAIKLDPDPKIDGLWVGDVSLARRDVRSRVEVHSLLVRKTELPSSSGVPTGIAHDRFALLSTGRPISLGVDFAERSIGGAVRMKWEDFRASDHPWRKRHHQDLYFLEVDPEHPILWLNSRHEKLRALLFEKGDAGLDAGLRDLVSGWLAEGVLAQLFHAALGTVREPGTEGEVVLPSGWRGDILRLFLEAMFPDLGDTQEALREAVRLRDSRDGMIPLVGLVSTAAQTAIGSHKVFTEAVRCIERGEREAR